MPCASSRPGSCQVVRRPRQVRRGARGGTCVTAVDVRGQAGLVRGSRARRSHQQHWDAGHQARAGQRTPEGGRAAGVPSKGRRVRPETRQRIPSGAVRGPAAGPGSNGPACRRPSGWLLRAPARPSVGLMQSGTVFYGLRHPTKPENDVLSMVPCRGQQPFPRRAGEGKTSW